MHAHKLETQEGWQASDRIQPKFKGLRVRAASAVNPSLMVGKEELKCQISISEAGTRRRMNSSFLYICSVQACNGLDDAHGHCRE